MSDAQVFQDVLARELDSEQRELLQELIRLDCGCAVLRFFYERPRESLALEDIAFHLNAQVPCVESTLHALVELGLAEPHEVAGLVFYRFAAYPPRQQLAHVLCRRQSQWQVALSRLQILPGQPATA